MASSDDEDWAIPQIVSDYHFVDSKNELVAFSELPIQWSDSEELLGERRQIFLSGAADNGLQKIYKQVTAWKFDLSDFKPEISVLSKENNWIRLQKPRKSFEDTIRTILITVYCLHFLKKNPNLSGRSLWNHMFEVFSLYKDRPSGKDLIGHLNLINEAVKRDERLAKSKFLVTFLKEMPQRKKEAFNEDIEDDYMADANEEDDGSVEQSDPFDPICAICDDGGTELYCDGSCMRSFHATVEEGFKSNCKSLGFSKEQAECINIFFCKNCQYKQHQCFACGELGSSDRLSGAEVFQCVSATCGHFYHPHCVAKLLHHKSPAEAEDLRKKILAGESFICPVHKCIVCKQGENKEDADFKFAVCRRCPKSYHRKCLPREIAFENKEDEGIVRRAWDDFPNHILIFCLEHEIDTRINTPIRNHIKFPVDGQNKKKETSWQHLSKEKVPQKERSLFSEDTSRKRSLGKLQLSSTVRGGDPSKMNLKRLIGSSSSKKQKAEGSSRKAWNNIASTEVFKSTTDGSRPSSGDGLYALMNSMNEDTSVTENKQAQTDEPVAKDMSILLQLDDVSKQRVLNLMKDAMSSTTLEAEMDKQKGPTTHSYSSKYMPDKACTLGKVEGYVQALRAALKNLEGGCSVENAKAVCEPGVLHQINRWKIVDVLHCYVQDGDMIVDFCCGANDFNSLMKKKLEKTGKKCSYKNYGIVQAKNDFNFEKRDWMTVDPKELPAGSQLIMGLNPPFGVNASLANKFIDKALEFEPKLLILVVPKETERLDEKMNPYDLVWENDELLSGKSFYLPGSVDVNGNQIEDWNVKPPLLYLWSRPDWTDEHMKIAQKHGHTSRVGECSYFGDHPNQPLVSAGYGERDHAPKGQTSMPIDDHPPVQNESREQLQERTRASEDNYDCPPHGNVIGQVQENHGHGINQATPDCGFGVKNTSEERFAGPRRGDASSHGYGSYLGQPTPGTDSRRSSLLAAAERLKFSSPRDHVGSTVNSSYSQMKNTSVGQRHAPQLDELNGHEPPPASRNSMPDPLPPRPQYHPHLSGFAPALSRSTSPHNSAGWLNE
ncbi:protein ENHANCED DOWNY MILDEW 2-like [Diospyros lotus]|uniref:protein ENHANCED DOWNY MILDEW 2-like n=1 Tax=Diospyros lotus TaxID=55363 RepID=UPI00225A6A73|nr:protein ENHANCED DOWNY MILDEW 2-like [Diospyros lotus]